ncbi:PEPxxWA-CTERM sorting domain-containing protein [Sandarakinorhabdus sp.]|uniref:PEPxxWA-CTERM sorting domain-containing protein n=1 Tax=Sandarakinorhabdus sp. TaxID=1916663 RepID=UPI00286E6011|nr:PEPxxWA-CTERM sorting domain-containing protein [Sandarakinorhabdus sp.]
MSHHFVVAIAAVVIASPAAAVTTVVTSATSAATVNTGALANSNLTAAYTAANAIVLVPRLALATRQTITSVKIELLISTTTTGTLTNGTGDQSVRTYRLANSFAGTLVGKLPTGTVQTFNPSFTSETNNVQAAGRQTANVNFTSGAPQLVSTITLTGGNLNFFNRNAFLADPFDDVFKMTLNMTGNSVASRPRDANGVVPSGNIGAFNRVLTTIINSSVRVTYVSREWIPGDAPVPEPASWAMMIAGFGLIGASMRRRRSALA